MIRKRWRRVFEVIVIGMVILLVFVIVNLLVPRGRIFEGEVRWVSEDSVEFLYDLTYADENGRVVYDHQIFDKFFEMIDNAETFVIVDMFLFGTTSEEVYRNLTQELTDHLLAKKNVNPDMIMYFITDYYNVINYGDGHLRQLDEAGIEVIFSSPNGKMSFGKTDYVNYIFKKFKGRLNHRKTVIADSGDKIVSLIISGNPHDASSPNSNVGFYFEEGIWRDIYGLEKEDFLVEDSELDLFFDNFEEKNGGDVFVQYLADGALMRSLKEEIDKTVEGDSIDVLMFYFSDKRIINSLLRASGRGVDVKLVLDVNIQSFGKKKFGVPNKPVAEKLIRKSGGKIEVRWYLSHGGQFHTKMAIIGKENENVVFLGSSNFARNDKIIYNLQSDVKVVASLNSSVSEDVYDYLNRIWFNENGTYTTDYEVFSDDSFSKRFRYWMEQIFVKFS